VVQVLYDFFACKQILPDNLKVMPAEEDCATPLQTEKFSENIICKTFSTENLCRTHILQNFLSAENLPGESL
jgi:hypothetical protein